MPIEVKLHGGIVALVAGLLLLSLGCLCVVPAALTYFSWTTLLAFLVGLFTGATTWGVLGMSGLATRFRTTSLRSVTRSGPTGLLERIIEASSNKGDIVLDPFCGCGTAVHAAQKLGRDWIGIDITHLSISLIEKRMKDAFPGLEFPVHGTPKDLEGARNLAERDKYQFQWWACSLVGAQPYQGKKKGADSGIDGIKFFQDDEQGAKKIIVSVKGGEHVTRTMIADLKNTVEREKAAMGLFITLTDPTEPMVKESVTAGFYESAKGEFAKIQILTIEDLLSGKKRPEHPDISSGTYNFKKAKKESKKVEKPLLKGF